MTPLLSSLVLADLDDGELPGKGLSTLDWLLLFGGVPLLASLVIVLLVYAPHWARGPRYRPGRAYDAGPRSFGEVSPATTAGSERDPANPAGGAGAAW